MQARSLLGSARVIDRRLDELLSATLLADAPEAWTHAAVIRATLGDVAEQLRASVPLPAASDDPDADDEQFLALLDALASERPPTPERVAEAAAGESRSAGESSAAADDSPASSGVDSTSGVDSESGVDVGFDSDSASGTAVASGKPTESRSAVRG